MALCWEGREASLRLPGMGLAIRTVFFSFTNEGLALCFGRAGAAVPWLTVENANAHRNVDSAWPEGLGGEEEALA